MLINCMNLQISRTKYLMKVIGSVNNPFLHDLVLDSGNYIDIYREF